MLGHRVPFSYCRTTGSDTLCRHIANCWFESFDIEGFLDANYSPEVVQRSLQPGRPKVESLLSLIERAKESTGRSA